MKSKRCPLLELHSGETCGKRNYARSSSICYSSNRTKSSRRKDPAVTDAEVEALKLKNKLPKNPDASVCSC